jgi:outer membrane protein assembly factor BamE (lipoprotein component of BamABCDE complex)
MNQPRSRFVCSFFGILSAICLMLFLSGCLVSGDSHQTRTGTYVSDNTFNQIRPGKTSEEWVRATLGPASSDKPLPDEGHILKWSYTERKESSGAVFLIFGGHDSKETTHTAYVETHHGMVTNAWRE